MMAILFDSNFTEYPAEFSLDALGIRTGPPGRLSGVAPASPPGYDLFFRKKEPGVKQALWAVVLVSGMAVAPAVAETARPLVVASGEVTGYYFPVAGALCRVVNKDLGGAKESGPCTVLPTKGSAANLEALRAGTADLALVQARAAQLAHDGQPPYKDAAQPDLRALMSLHGESVLVLARQGAGVESMADLKGKRVNLGRPGSFQRAMAEATLEAAGLSEGDLAPAVELELAEQSQQLCEGNIDVAFYAGIHPMEEAALAVDECDAVAIPIKAKTLESYLKRNPWLSHAVVRKSAYDGLKSDMTSLQVRALLVASARLPADQVHDVMKAVFANFSALTHLHPVLQGLSKAEAVHDGMVVPLHDGADHFYGEAGLK